MHTKIILTLKNWFFTGLLLCSFFISLEAFAASMYVTTGVSENNSDGDCSFEEAWETLRTGSAVDNCTVPDDDTIRFNISTGDASYDSGSQTFDIDLDTSLTAMADAFTIDGSNQSGSVCGTSSPTIKIHLDGSNATGTNNLSSTGGEIDFNCVLLDTKISITGGTPGETQANTPGAISGNSYDWTGLVANVQTDDTNYVAHDFSSNCNSPSGPLYLDQFGFTESDVPINATIDGVEVSVVRRRNGGSYDIYDSAIQLVGSDGYETGNTKTDVSAWSTSEETITYGGPTDKWGISGATLTDSLVRNSNFGVRLVTDDSSNCSGTAQYDLVTIKIYFSPDETAPTATSPFSPVDGATNVETNDLFEISFSEDIKLGSGNIVIKDDTNTTTFATISVTDDDQVSILGGDTLLINPTGELLTSTNYHIEIANGAIKDLAGNNFAGITNSTTWNFTTISTSASGNTNFLTPTVKSGSGWSGLVAAAQDDDNSYIDYAFSGSCNSPSDELLLQDFNITNSDVPDNATINGVTVYVIRKDNTDDSYEIYDGTLQLIGSDGYAAGTTKSNGNAWSATEETIEYGGTADKWGISAGTLTDTYVRDADFGVQITADDSSNCSETAKIEKVFMTINYTLDNTAPTVSTYDPLDGATNVETTDIFELTFSENIQAGSGNIVIKDDTNTNTFATISITDDDQVSIIDDKLIINPTNAFLNNTNYHIEIDSGAIQDLGGNDYAGISNSTTWNFTTVTTTTSGNSNFLVPTAKDGSDWTGLIATVQDDDNSYMTHDFGSNCNSPSAGLQLEDFNITNSDVPANATIDGITVYITRKDDANDNDEVYDNSIQLIGSDGYVAGTQKTDANAWSSTEETIIYGGPSDKWGIAGATLTDSYIKDVDFGVEITADDGGNCAEIAKIEQVLMMIHYTEDTTNPTASTFVPADNATGVSISDDLSITFDEDIQAMAGTNNDIEIRKTTGGTLVEEIDAQDSKITISGATMTIDPTSDLEADTEYYVLVEADAIDDMPGNSFAGISSSTTWSFTTAAGGSGAKTPGTFNTTVVSSYGWGGTVSDVQTPSDSNVADFDFSGACTSPSAALKLTNFGFTTSDIASGNIVDGVTVNITRKNNGGSYNIKDYSVKLINESGTVVGNNKAKVSNWSASGETITYGGAADDWGASLLDSDIRHSNFGVEIIADDEGNCYDVAEIDYVTIEVTSSPDTTAPTLSSSTPADNATGVLTGDNIVLNFNENVQAGTGNIVITETGVGTFESIPVGNAKVTFDGSQVTINPAGTMSTSTGYDVQLVSGVIEDMAGNDYAGITNSTTLNFTTGTGGSGATSPTTPGTFTTGGSSSYVWTGGVSDVQTNDTSYAEYDFSSCYSSYAPDLKLTNFGFTTSEVPSGATIAGITVSVVRQNHGGNYDLVDHTVKLIDDSGTAVGNNKANVNAWSTSEETITYGGAADTWGAGLTDTDVRHSNFGVLINVDDSYYCYDTARIDLVTVTINYTTGGAFHTPQPSPWEDLYALIERYRTILNKQS